MLTILLDSNSGKMLSRLQNCRTTLPQGSNHLPFESSRAPRSRDRDCAVFGPRASKPTSVAIPTGALGIEGFPNSVSRPSTPIFHSACLEEKHSIVRGAERSIETQPRLPCREFVPCGRRGFVH
jgi:hypothetical protein